MSTKGEFEFSLTEVSKEYNPGLFSKKVRSVEGLSLNIIPGEVFGLVGPNGAGKSSTIRMMLGLSKPTSGTVTFRGQGLDQIDFRSFIGYLPENPYLYDHLTLNELLDFVGAFTSFSNSQVTNRLDDLLTKTDMQSARNRPLRTFSKGMLQRAGLCFALARDPEVVILDEPMSGLDPLGRKMVLDLILELKAQGKTVFFCSHILNDVERLCDRVGVMNKGRILKILSKEDLSGLSSGDLVLVVDEMADEVRGKIIALNCRCVGTRIYMSSSCFYQVCSVLESTGVQIVGIENEAETLEDVFVAMIQTEDA